MPRRPYKFKLLLDEGFHLRERLPITNSRFNVKHVAADYHKNGLPDSKVFELASASVRLVVTYNMKDFRSLVGQSNTSGVIGISPNLSLEHLDKKLTALLSHATPKQLFGKFVIITEEAEV